MRIAMTSPYDLGVPGGVQGQVVGLSRALRSLGHEVVALVPGRPGAPGPVVSLGRAVGVRANGSVAPVVLSPLAARRAHRVLQEGRFDVVHLHEPLAPVLNYGCLFSRAAPVVATFHRNGDSSLYRALSPAVRLALSRIDVCCAVSESARDLVAPYVASSVRVLFNGVEVDRLAAVAPAPTAGPTLLFVGRHEPRKGLACLLEAVERMACRPNLWVAGAGPETAALRARHPASDRVSWLGAISEEEKAARLAGAAVLCAPSTGGESFGVVLLEAMAARCAVVASDIDGYRQAAGGHAELVPPADPAALAAALDRALLDAAAGTGRSSPAALDAAFAYAQRWSMDELARRYVEIYEEARAGGRRGRPGRARQYPGTP